MRADVHQRRLPSKRGDNSGGLSLRPGPSQNARLLASPKIMRKPEPVFAKGGESEHVHISIYLEFIEWYPSRCGTFCGKLGYRNAPTSRPPPARPPPSKICTGRPSRARRRELPPEQPRARRLARHGESAKRSRPCPCPRFRWLATGRVQRGEVVRRGRFGGSLPLPPGTTQFLPAEATPTNAPGPRCTQPPTSGQQRGQGKNLTR
jgi:hypothetical protein